MSAALASVRLFFDHLPAASGLGPERILFVLDGVRRDIYAGRKENRGSYFSRVRAEFIAAARAGGYEVIDLQRVFSDDYAQHRQRFENPLDNHWGAMGHYVVAKAVMSSVSFQALFGTVPGFMTRPE